MNLYLSLSFPACQGAQSLCLILFSQLLSYISNFKEVFCLPLQADISGVKLCELWRQQCVDRQSGSSRLVCCQCLQLARRVGGYLAISGCN